MDNKKRCFGGGKGKKFYAHYHDHEWGIPLHEEVRLFEINVGFFSQYVQFIITLISGNFRS